MEIKLRDIPDALWESPRYWRVRWYELVPARLHFVDNAAGFGYRDEVPL